MKFQDLSTKNSIIIITIAAILICALSFIFRKLEINNLDRVCVEIYNDGATSLDYEYNDKFKDKKQITNWIRLNNSSLYHLTFNYYAPEALLTFNDGKAIVIFNKTSIMCYIKGKYCISYYSRRRQRFDDLFLESLRSVEN